MPNAQPLNLTTRPARVETCGGELASAIAAIRRAGAYPAGMEHPRPGCYVIRVDYPPETLFSPVLRQGAVNQDAL